MSIKLLAAAAAAATMSLTACATVEDAAAVAQTALTTDETPETALPYVAMAGASDLYEIQSSQLHHRQGQDPRLHSFASMLIDHHTRTTNATMAAARSAGLSPPPPTLMPLQRQMIERLQGLRGAEFDREYLRQQVLAHEIALRVHENYAKAGDTPSLRTSASAAVPVVRGHLDQARGMKM